MEEANKKVVVSFLSSFPCHTFPPLSSLPPLSLSCCFPLPHYSYMLHYKSISGISPAPFPRPMRTRKIHRRARPRESIFIYNSEEQERGERERVVFYTTDGSGRAGGQAHAGKRCREASEDWVHRLRGAYLSTSLARTQTQAQGGFFPRGCFGLLDVYGLQACIYVRVSCACQCIIKGVLLINSTT